MSEELLDRIKQATTTEEVAALHVEALGDLAIQAFPMSLHYAPDERALLVEVTKQRLAELGR